MVGSGANQLSQFSLKVTCDVQIYFCKCCMEQFIHNIVIIILQQSYYDD